MNGVLKCCTRPTWDLSNIISSTHFYLTRLNLEKMGRLQFCLSIFIGMHRNPKQKEFFNSCEGFLMATLIWHSHTGPLYKIVEMALFNPCMKSELLGGQMRSFEVLWKCHSVILSKICLRFHPSVDKSGWMGLFQKSLTGITKFFLVMVPMSP